jgi:hypothetical protein
LFPPEAVLSANRTLNELTLPVADVIRADARRFRQLVASDTAKAARPPFFAQDPETEGSPNSTSATASEPADRKTRSDGDAIG